MAEPADEPCLRCGFIRPVLDGADLRRRRKEAGLTLTDMARIYNNGVRHGMSRSHLSRMERGEIPFTPKVVALYERILERRRRSGDES